MNRKLMLMLLLLIVAIIGMPEAFAVSISGTVFNDINNNSRRDAGEPGLSNWTLILNLTDPPPPGSTQPPFPPLNTTTDANGNYSFSLLDSQLPPAATFNYTLEENLTLKPGWIQTFPAAPGIYNASFTTGQNVTGKDFGNFLPSGGSGIAAFDTNFNGRIDRPEAVAAVVQFFGGSIQRATAVAAIVAFFTQTPV